MPTAPTAPGLVPHVGALTGMEAGPFLPAPGSEAPFWRGTVHQGSVCDIEPRISLEKCSSPRFPAWMSPRRKADGVFIFCRSLPCMLGDTSWLLVSSTPASGVSKTECRRDLL